MRLGQQGPVLVRRGNDRNEDGELVQLMFTLVDNWQMALTEYTSTEVGSQHTVDRSVRFNWITLAG